MPKIVLELSKECENVTLPIKGEMPFWLSGTVVRNGPVQFAINDQQVNHWFDGLGMLHAFSFQKGQIKYSNRFLRSKAFEEVTEKGTFNYVGFASDPCRTLFKRMISLFFPSKDFPIHNANINVSKIAEQCVALYETPLPVCFDLKTLETLGVFDFKDPLPKDSCFESAHPHHQSAESINYIVAYGLNSKYIIYRINKDSSHRETIAEIPVDNPSYMHSFAVTERYVILVEYPLVINPWKFLVRNLPFIKNYQWKPERGTQFVVVDKMTGQVVTKVLTESFFAFHHVNAFEHQDQIILDIITYPDASIIDVLAHHSTMDLPTNKLLRGNETAQTSLKRFKLCVKTRKITSETLFNEPHELPRIHPAHDGKPYRFTYASDVRKPSSRNDFRKIYKIDLETKQILFWNEDECYPGEPIFIPAPQASQEDEGCLLIVVLNLNSLNSFLLCLNAKNLEEIARAEVPFQIPQGLHGQYFS